MNSLLLLKIINRSNLKNKHKLLFSMLNIYLYNMIYITKIKYIENKDVKANDLNIYQLRNIKYLDCKKTNITNNILKKFKLLEGLNCSETKITNRGIRVLKNLKYLICWNTLINKKLFNNKGMLNLELLFVGYLDLEIKNIIKLKKLIHFSCFNSDINNVNIKRISNITKFN